MGHLDLSFDEIRSACTSTYITCTSTYIAIDTLTWQCGKAATPMLPLVATSTPQHGAGIPGAVGLPCSTGTRHWCRYHGTLRPVVPNVSHSEWYALGIVPAPPKERTC